MLFLSLEGCGVAATSEGAPGARPPSPSSRLRSSSGAWSPPFRSLCSVPTSVPAVAETASGSPAPLRGASRRSTRPEGGPAAAADDTDTAGVGVGASEAAPPSMLAPEPVASICVSSRGHGGMHSSQNDSQAVEIRRTDRALRLRAASCTLLSRWFGRLTRAGAV